MSPAYRRPCAEMDAHLGTLELEPDAESSLERLLVLDYPSEVRVGHAERELRIVVVINWLAPVEQVEHVGENDNPALAADVEPVIRVHIDGCQPRCAVAETVHGFKPRSARRLGYFAWAVVHRVGGQGGQGRARERIESESHVHSNLRQIVSKDLEL